jgi:UDP-arabinose 4-epimerase
MKMECKVRPNVLVTGGAGYIGSHACKALSAAGYQPITIDNFCLGHREFVKWGPQIEADVRDTAAVVKAIRDYNVVGILHFAAFAYVGESMTDPAKYYENNVVAMLSLLSAMRQTNLRKLVFSSTCAVYGTPTVNPINEQVPTNPVNPYGRSKLMCENILTDYVAAYGFERVALRYFNASGDDLSSGIGEKRDAETHLIPRAMMALQGHVRDFEVYGFDFPTKDGTAVRDYIHVRDLADAHVLALRHLLAGDAGGVFNLGAERGYSVKEVLTAVSAVSGRSLRAPTGARRPGDPPELIADTKLARDVLGFDPKSSDLQTIVESAWRWHTTVHPLRIEDV